MFASASPTWNPPTSGEPSPSEHVRLSEEPGRPPVIDPFPIAVTKKLPDMESDLVMPFSVCVIMLQTGPFANQD